MDLQDFLAIFEDSMIGIFCGTISIALVETILAIETSTPQGSIALWSDGSWLLKNDFTSDRNHNSMLFDPLAEALDCLEGRPLSAVIVGSGPGSYSGIRIGIAAAQGVAIARDCPLAGLGSLAATPVARAAANSPQAQVAMAIGDARRGMYFVAPIMATGEAMEAELMDADSFRARLEGEPDSRLFTLDEPDKLGLDERLEARVAHSCPEAGLLMNIWLGLDPSRRDELFSQPLAPSYLRAPFTSKAKSGHPLLRKE